MSSTICPVFCLERVPRPQYREGEPRQIPGIGLSSKNGAESPGEPRWLELTGLSIREERAAQRDSPGDVHRVPLKYSPED